MTKEGKDDKVYLQHVRDAIDRILKYTAVGKQQFLKDEMMQDAVIRNIGIVGEAVRHLSPAVTNLHPEIPWKQITAMRNKMIHDYFGVRLDLVWDVVERDLPGFRKQVEEILEELGGPPEPAS